MSMFFLSRVKHFLSLDARKLLYFSHVHSHLTYCLPLLTLVQKTDLNALCTLQRKAIKTTFNVSQRSSSTEFFHDLGTFPLDLLLEKYIIKTMHELHSYGKPKEIKEYFFKAKDISIEHSYNLRDIARFEMPLLKSIRLSSSPIFNFVFVFNSFPHDFKAIMEHKTFIEKHIEYYNSKIPSENCSKKFCKICDHRAFKDRMIQFYSLPKTYNYQRYR